MKHHLFSRFFRRRHHRHGGVHCPYKDYQTLNQVMENEQVLILCNPDRKTLEMGLYPGSVVTIMRNDSIEQNLIIAIENGRYIIARNIAERIRIRPMATAS
ncbi:MAG TPA: FeoA family protein [Candidatus Cloacimonadota bacterium]|nr:FeoA family protein [Candidatus Cloacimonadota bacterium]HPT71284.1 FeoA family protein [Candidatus Cloacimonadota bacterium]